MASRVSSILPFFDLSKNQIRKILGNQENRRRYSGLKPLPFLNTSVSDDPEFGKSGIRDHSGQVPDSFIVHYNIPQT